MRCEYCGGLIIIQKAYPGCPERRYCFLCGREPKLEKSQKPSAQGCGNPKGDNSMAGEPETKVCTVCRAEKPISEFGILKSSEDGHNSKCFPCKRNYDQKHRSKKAKRKATSRVKVGVERPKIPESEKREKIVQPDQPTITETHLIAALKRNAIKGFIKNDLLPWLEKTTGEKLRIEK
jgi:hypothetical protein